jgi:hypothetical protein
MWLSPAAHSRQTGDRWSSRPAIRWRIKTKEVTTMSQTISFQPNTPRAVLPRRVAEHPVPLKLTAAETGQAFSLSEVHTPPLAEVPRRVRHF